LIDKGAYVRHFFATIKRGEAPRVSRFVALWNHLIASCATSGG